MGFASDIELLTVYEGAGQTNGRKSLDNAVFYEKLVRFLLKHLRVRQEGIFQIDLQLRPYGNKGPLANSLGAFRDYYSPTGPARQFERLAFVKLRPICGDADFVRVIMACRDAFVYSGQSVDYQNIRYLRQRQVEELVNPKTVNIKLSPGGLVDIEYFIQAKQLEAGADDPGVRVANTMAALQKLGTAGVIPTPQVENIHRAYRFLRRTIDALRVVRGNARDLTVPDSGSPAFSYLTRRLGYENEEAFIRDLDWSLAIGRSLWASGPAEDSPEASTGPA
jgi:glutamate-ammonia-ligase adenylyltransferase